MTLSILPIMKRIFISSTIKSSRIKSVWRIAKLTSYASGLAINLYNLCSLSRDKVKELSKNTVSQIDSNNTIATDTSNYVLRLNKLIKNELNVDSISINYKVYITSEVNAISFPDGSIRINSGLMDSLDDNELLFIIGHEICHIIKSHSLKAMRMAIINYTIAQSINMVCPYKIGILASLFSNIGNAFINAKYSQRNEIEADRYGFIFLKTKGDNIKAASSALRKLPENDTDKFSSQFLTHPKLQKRIERLDKMIKNER